MSLVTTANHSPELEEDRELEEGNLSEDLEWPGFLLHVLLLSHRPPARLNHSTVQVNTADSHSLSLSPLGLFIEHASGWRPLQRNSTLQPFGIPRKWPAWFVWLKTKNENGKKYKKKTLKETAWPHTVLRWWTQEWKGGREGGWERGAGRGGVQTHENTWAGYVRLKARGLVYCQKKNKKRKKK